MIYRKYENDRVQSNLIRKGVKGAATKTVVPETRASENGI